MDIRAFPSWWVTNSTLSGSECMSTQCIVLTNPTDWRTRHSGLRHFNSSCSRSAVSECMVHYRQPEPVCNGRCLRWCWLGQLSVLASSKYSSRRRALVHNTCTSTSSSRLLTVSHVTTMARCEACTRSQLSSAWTWRILVNNLSY